MNNPSPRFTGIFIPSEILEMDNLTLFEMILLSWIDALYCPKHGGCVASNEYLGRKIKNAQENTVAKAITKLRSLGLIENISFDGRVRVIRALVSRHNEEESEYVLIRPDLIQDSRLSLVAREFYIRIVDRLGTKSNNISKKTLKEKFGIRNLYSSLSELEEFGYVTIEEGNVYVRN